MNLVELNQHFNNYIDSKTNEIINGLPLPLDWSEDRIEVLNITKNMFNTILNDELNTSVSLDDAIPYVIYVIENREVEAINKFHIYNHPKDYNYEKDIFFIRNPYHHLKEFFGNYLYNQIYH